MPKNSFYIDTYPEVKISRVKIVRSGNLYIVYALEEGKNRFFFWNWFEVFCYLDHARAAIEANEILKSGVCRKQVRYPRSIEIAVRGKSE